MRAVCHLTEHVDPTQPIVVLRNVLEEPSFATPEVGPVEASHVHTVAFGRAHQVFLREQHVAGHAARCPCLIRPFANDRRLVIHEDEVREARDSERCQRVRQARHPTEHERRVQ